MRRNFPLPPIVYSTLLLFPPLTHLNRLCPPPKHLLPLVLANLRLEHSPSSGIDLLQLIIRAPDADGKAGCDGGTESGGFAHLGPLDGDADDVGLGLDVC
jgi:hypothetical protein